MNDVGANLFGKNMTMNEREDEVKMKMKFKRILLGVMDVATLASVIVQPMTVSASEKEPEVTGATSSLDASVKISVGYSIMTMRKFITKGVLPLILFRIITWLGQYIFMVDGSIDWFQFRLVYGVPIGIPYMVIIISIKMDLSGTTRVLALGILIGAVFGFFIAAGIAVRAI